MSSAVRKFLGVFGAFVLLSGLLSMGGTAVAAASTYEVTVGSGFGIGGANCNHNNGRHCQAFAEDFRIIPGSLKVAKGDVVHFSSGPIALLPANTDVQAWIDDNASGIDEPWNVAVSDPDDGALKINNKLIFSATSNCGSVSTPCDYDGASLMSSPIDFNGPGDFSATINATVGDTVWVVPLFTPLAYQRIQVVAAGQATDPSTLAALTRQQLDRDLDTAESLHDKLWNRQSKHVVNGKTVWDAWAGFDTRYLGLSAMYPHVLHVHKGAKVRWHFEELVNNTHTVTFPFGKGSQISNNSFQPTCDPDGDTGPGPDTQPTSQSPPFCTDPTQLEFDLDAPFTDPHGNHVLSSATDFESSGLMDGIGALNKGTAYDVTFKKVSPKAGFKYLCMFHGPQMNGIVHVAA